MTATPWGPSEDLRGRMLKPGPGTPPEEVIRKQKERLYGAMVATVAERGYADTRVTDLLELSGISRRSFYALFPDLDACFRATVNRLVKGGMAVWSSLEQEDAPWEELEEKRLEAFGYLCVHQFAAAKVLLVDAYVSGPEAVATVEVAIAELDRLVARGMKHAPGREEMPFELTSALVGAVLEIARNRLMTGTQAELPALGEEISLALRAYEPPLQPLRLSTRSPARPEETGGGHDHRERALRAFTTLVAEDGYPNVTVAQVARRAAMSPSTIYANFTNKEDILIAAIDSAGAQIEATVVPAFERAGPWPQAVRAAFGALFNFLSSKPALATLVLAEVYAAGPKAIERRARALRSFGALVTDGLAQLPSAPPISVELCLAAFYSLGHRQVRASGPESLPALAPICTYLVVAPAIGAEAATRAANDLVRHRGADGAGDERASDAMRLDAQGWQELLALHERTREDTLESCARSEERLRESGDPAIDARSIQALLELPPRPVAAGGRGAGDGAPPPP